jgi:hypothetical protein
MGPRCDGRPDARRRQPPVNAKAGDTDQNGNKQNSSRHSPIRGQASKSNRQYGVESGHKLLENFQGACARSGNKTGTILF